MNIHNFQQHIDEKILDRGYDYYLDGHVEKKRKRDNEYVFYVEGTEQYEVLVEIGDCGEILYSDCDCPYDFGSICKHEVAAYFELREMSQSDDAGKMQSSKNNNHTLRDVLKNLSKGQLIDIIIEFTHDDVTLEERLMFTYAKGDSELEIQKCQTLIQAIVNKYSGRDGFIRYGATFAFSDELEEVLDKAKKTDELLIATDIALLVLESAIDSFSYADDSGGMIGAVATEAIEILKEIAEKSVETNDQKTTIFEKILAETDNDVFEGWSDFLIDLLSICTRFADDEQLRKRFITKLDSMIEHDSNDHYVDYTNERLLQLKFQLIESFGTKQEIEQFAQEHLQYSSFREVLLNMHLKKKNYEKVLELAIEGEKQDQEYPGLISKWKEYRYKALKSLSLKEEQQKLAKELFLNGNFDYYEELKEMAADQKGLYNRLKLEVKKGNGWRSNNLLLKLIEEENDLDELLEFVQNNPLYIEDYAEMLVDYFEEDVIEIYADFIRNVARNSSNRKAYQDVCNKLKRFKKIAGQENQKLLINEFKDLYKRRPAFLDELSKI